MKKISVAIILLFAIQINKANAQVLETEDSRPLNNGQAEIGGALEYQTPQKKGTNLPCHYLLNTASRSGLQSCTVVQAGYCMDIS